MNDTFIFRLLIVVSAIVIIFALVAQYNKTKKDSKDPIPVEEGFQSYVPSAPPHMPEPSPSPQLNRAHGMDREIIASPPAPPIDKLVHPDPAPFESLDTEMYRSMDYKPEDSKKKQPDPFPKERLTKDDLLPKNAANTKWAQVNPSGQGDLEGVNMLDAGWNFGIDTQGQTLRNPNLQLRSEFPNPREDIGPWQQSTIENDCSRRYFEIGQP